MISEHFDDGSRLGATALKRLSAIFACWPVKHGSRFGQGLCALVVEQSIDIGYQLPNHGIQLQALAKAGNEPCGHGESLVRLGDVGTTQGAYPQMRSPCHRIGSCQGLPVREFVGDVAANVLHPCKDIGLHALALVLSKHIRFNIGHMFYEPSTLASVTGLLATALREHYGIDPEPVYREAGIPLGTPDSPQRRYPISAIRKLWALGRTVTGDDAVGLQTGRFARPTQFYAFGYSWLASATLLGGMKRLVRYYRLLSTASAELSIRDAGDTYALSARFPDPALAPPVEGIDAGMTALLALCDAVTLREIRPVRIDLTCGPDVHPEAYRELLRAPIRFNADVGAFFFAKETLEAPLPGASPDIANATDKIAEHYIETLDPHKVASQVRRLLINLLPSGDASQEAVASRLNRSASTLQRQLQTEGLNYRDVLESTRRSFAEEYLAEGRHSHAQIAYLLGFSDQSNFSRAFKRWTSVSPRTYQDRLKSAN